jgi:hypothetical protein
LPVHTSALRVEEALGNSRKWFRVLRSLESLAKAQVLVAKLSGKKGSLVNCFELVQQGGLFSFFLVDHIWLLTKMGVSSFANLDEVILRRYFGGTFLTACAGGFASNVTRIHEIQCLPASGNASLAIYERRRSAQFENIVDGLKNGMDCVIGANIAYDKKWNNGVIGAIGVTTSTIWLWQYYCNMVYNNVLADRLAIPKEQIEV